MTELELQTVSWGWSTGDCRPVVMIIGLKANMTVGRPGPHTNGHDGAANNISAPWDGREREKQVNAFMFLFQGRKNTTYADMVHNSYLNVPFYMYALYLACS